MRLFEYAHRIEGERFSESLISLGKRKDPKGNFNGWYFILMIPIGERYEFSLFENRDKWMERYFVTGLIRESINKNIYNRWLFRKISI